MGLFQHGIFCDFCYTAIISLISNIYQSDQEDFLEDRLFSFKLPKLPSHHATVVSVPAVMSAIGRRIRSCCFDRCERHLMSFRTEDR